jgi:hypothetical protein
MVRGIRLHSVLMSYLMDGSLRENSLDEFIQRGGGGVGGVL